MTFVPDHDTVELLLILGNDQLWIERDTESDKFVVRCALGFPRDQLFAHLGDAFRALAAECDRFSGVKLPPLPVADSDIETDHGVGYRCANPACRSADDWHETTDGYWHCSACGQVHRAPEYACDECRTATVVNVPALEPTYACESCGKLYERQLESATVDEVLSLLEPDPWLRSERERELADAHAVDLAEDRRLLD